MRLHLQNYDIHVEYKKGVTMFLADTLSRACLESESVTRLRIATPVLPDNNFAGTRREQQELQILSDIICEGWPETLAQACDYKRRRKQVIELYWNSLG